MKWHGVSVYTGGDFKFTRPKIYTNGAWKDGTYYVYTGGAWKMIGGAATQMVPFIASDGSPVYVGGEQMLVRQMLGGVRLLESGNSTLIDNENVPLYSDYRGG